ncbi:MAG TPA: hypothetical protein DDX91_04780, partial [Ruminococcaceae bacterium]|nr:hypothetical protein [Oscillospiraceae bacterium]
KVLGKNHRGFFLNCNNSLKIEALARFLIFGFAENRRQLVEKQTDFRVFRQAEIPCQKQGISK